MGNPWPIERDVQRRSVGLELARVAIDREVDVDPVSALGERFEVRQQRFRIARPEDEGEAARRIERDALDPKALDQKFV